jgi:arginyl-tRNA synthetase
MLQKVRNEWKTIVQNQIIEMAKSILGEDAKVPELTIQVPPKPELGDVAFPLFSYAKVLRMAPNKIAATLKNNIESLSEKPAGELLLAGPYLNVKIDVLALATSLYKVIGENEEDFGKNNQYDGKKIMIEFSCPNTNKPLHLGHMRNDSLGMSVSSILKANGADVMKVNLINNRGVHICKSMLAYQKFGNGETPESTGIKGDHLVGKYYVKFAQWEKEDDTAVDQAKAMLVKWESGDEEVLALWKRMNGWTLDGLAESYKDTGVSFDKYYYESETYKLGKDKVLQGLKDGVFYKEEDGSVWMDLEDIKLDKKVLLRNDGTSLYMTQDIGTAISRHEDFPFESLVYVVASEQQYHFKVLFHILKSLGYKWADELFHLSYGMVNLPDGKMKSREGTVVDADALFASLSQIAKQEIIDKERDDKVDGLDKTSKAIALSALNYYLLQVSPTKDMIFDSKKSISFNGNTGPYLQYMGARISSMSRKFDELKADYEGIKFDSKYLTEEEERELIKIIALYPEIVEKAGKDFDPSVICSYLYDLTKLFSKWYHDNKILKADDKNVVVARMGLARMVLQVIKNAFPLVGITFLDSM